MRRSAMEFSRNENDTIGQEYCRQEFVGEIENIRCPACGDGAIILEELEETIIPGWVIRHFECDTCGRTGRHPN